MNTQIGLHVLIVLSFVFTICLANDVSVEDGYSMYTNYKILDVGALKGRPKLLALNELKDRQNESFSGIIFFDDVITSKVQSRFIVSESKLDSVKSFLKEHEIEFQTRPNDVKEVLEEWEKSMNADLKKRYGEGDDSLPLNHFLPYNEMMKHIRKLTAKSPIAGAFSLGKTVEGRQIPLIKVNADNKNLPIVLIDAGSDPRKWMSSSTALFFLHQLLFAADAQFLRDNFRWIILPNLNPDGYAYTWTKDRFWRKNRSSYPKALHPAQQGLECFGVDLKRNWDSPLYYTGNPNPCSPFYKGPGSFSEPETLLLKDFILKQKRKILLYISVQSHGQTIVAPGMRKGFMENDRYDELASVARLAIESIQSQCNNREYAYGVAYETKYPVPGTSYDWAFHNKRIDELTGQVVPDDAEDKPRLKWTFAFDLPPKSGDPEHLIPIADPPSEITNTGAEFTGAVLAMCQKLHVPKRDEL